VRFVEHFTVDATGEPRADFTFFEHVKRILMKLGLRDRIHAVIYTCEIGLTRR